MDLYIFLTDNKLPASYFTIFFFYNANIPLPFQHNIVYKLIYWRLVQFARIPNLNRNSTGYI